MPLERRQSKETRGEIGEDVTLLGEIPLFQGLSDETLMRLGHVSVRRVHECGSEFAFPRAGEESALIVVEGGIEAIVIGTDGRELSAFQIRSGEVLDVAESEDQVDDCMVIVAMEPHTVVYTLPWTIFVCEISSAGESSIAIVEQLRQQRRRAVRLAADVALCDVETRIAHVLHPSKEVSYTLEELSRMAGTSMGRASRVIAKLRRQGVVTERTRGRLVIQNPDELL
jgi:CRP-like cAMP-binding protein